MLFRAVLISLGLVASGCVCTLIGASSGLVVELDPIDGAGNEASLPVGEYPVIARTEGHELTLAHTIDGTGGGNCNPCRVEVASGPHTLVFDGYITDRSSRLNVFYLDDDQSGPDVVSIEVRRADQTIALETYTPTYSPFNPNSGPGCDGEVMQAREDLTILVQ